MSQMNGLFKLLTHSHVVRTRIGRRLIGAVLTVAKVIVYLREQYALAALQTLELFGHLNVEFGPLLAYAGHVDRHLI